MKTISDCLEEFKESKKQIIVIFLDVDGVMNNEEFASESDVSDSRDEWGSKFCPKNIANLKRIIDECGGNDKVKIVLSSSHRHGSRTFYDDNGNIQEFVGLKYIQEMWKGRKLPGDVIDITPYYHLKKGANKLCDSILQSPNISIPRGYEIKQWLNCVNYHHEYYSFMDCNTLISNYIIIDDDQDMLYEQRNNFVRTSSEKGLDDIATNKVINILNNK